MSSKLLRKPSRGWNAVKALTYPKDHDDEITDLGIASSGKYVVTCSKKTDLVVCDIKGALLGRLDTYLMNTSCTCLSPCGRYISACGSTTCFLFEAEGKFVLVSGDKHVRIFHNVTGYKATAKAAREKLSKPNNTSAVRERLPKLWFPRFVAK